ncbi:hypothetical protein NP493_5646g00000 [Ridgeia piscesae]|uniref:Uncharacterized protein n=1 Tax=Ridgeia piscesae TaxID=27915 RepID=A0AAD9MPK4_RIDPI|nr:hypothetical protein NP493_5646g00000 [Ridgeia piscesae]
MMSRVYTSLHRTCSSDGDTEATSTTDLSASCFAYQLLFLLRNHFGTHHRLGRCGSSFGGGVRFSTSCGLLGATVTTDGSADGEVTPKGLLEVSREGLGESPRDDPQEGPRDDPQESPRDDPCESPRDDTRETPRGDTREAPRADAPESPRDDVRSDVADDVADTSVESASVDLVRDSSDFSVSSSSSVSAVDGGRCGGNLSAHSCNVVKLIFDGSSSTSNTVSAFFHTSSLPFPELRRSSL